MFWTDMKHEMVYSTQRGFLQGVRNVWERCVFSHVHSNSHRFQLHLSAIVCCSLMPTLNSTGNICRSFPLLISSGKVWKSSLGNGTSTVKWSLEFRNNKEKKGKRDRSGEIPGTLKLLCEFDPFGSCRTWHWRQATTDGKIIHRELKGRQEGSLNLAECVHFCLTFTVIFSCEFPLCFEQIKIPYCFTEASRNTAHSQICQHFIWIVCLITKKKENNPRLKSGSCAPISLWFCQVNTLLQWKEKPRVKSHVFNGWPFTSLWE